MSPIAAITLAGVLLLTGCTSGGSTPGRSLPPAASTTELKARAALDPCPQVPRPPPPGRSGTGGLPDIQLACLGDGPAVRLTGLTGPAVVNLWAAWCDPCRREAPAFQRLHAAAGDRLRVLGVLTEDTTRDALDAAAHWGIHYPSVVDADGEMKARSGVQGLPVTYFVSASGEADRYVGPPLSYDQLRRLVAQHLGVRV